MSKMTNMTLIKEYPEGPPTLSPSPNQHHTTPPKKYSSLSTKFHLEDSTSTTTLNPQSLNNTNHAQYTSKN